MSSSLTLSAMLGEVHVAERWNVAPEVAGSSPVAQPKYGSKLEKELVTQLVEYQSSKLGVAGSRPV